MASPSRISQFLLSVTGLFCVAVATTGCGFTAAPPGSSGTVFMQGTVMGGQQPVAGSQVRLYVAGSGGNASLATDLMGTGTGSKLAYTTTDKNGQFSLQGDFTCPVVTPTYIPQVYLVASGGNPGLAGTGTGNNASLVMVDALGPCGNIGTSTQVTINEVTTVAAAWALSGFATSATNIGSTSTNSTGLANAFLNAQLIADPATGVSPGSSLALTNTLEVSKIYALADVIATCVNSDGTTPCQTLFTASGVCTSSCVSDTFSAALGIVKNPAINVPGIFGLIPPNQPYTTTLATAPHDWTLSMTVTGGALNSPTELAVDTLGNVWVANYVSTDYSSGTVSAFSPQGNAITTGANGFGYKSFGPDIYGLAIDSSNNVWVDIEQKPSGYGSIGGLNGISSGNTLGSVITIQTSPYFDYPEALATGVNGSILIANNGSSTASIFNYTPSTGFNITLGYGGYGYSSYPTDVAGDVNGGAWLADEGTYTVTHIDASGNLISHPSCCDTADGVATDKFGNAWISNYFANSVSEIGPGCDSNASPNAYCYNNQGNVILIGATTACGTNNAPAGSCGDTNGGLNTPSKISVDAAQNVWVVNSHAQTITELAGNASSLPAGTGISPNSIYNADGSVKSQGGYGLDAKISTPFDLALDASGNVWVSSEANSKVVMFFGLAAPTATPKLPVPVTP